MTVVEEESLTKTHSDNQDAQSTSIISTQEGKEETCSKTEMQSPDSEATNEGAFNNHIESLGQTEVPYKIDHEANESVASGADKTESSESSKSENLENSSPELASKEEKGLLNEGSQKISVQETNDATKLDQFIKEDTTANDSLLDKENVSNDANDINTEEFKDNSKDDSAKDANKLDQEIKGDNLSQESKKDLMPARENTETSKPNDAKQDEEIEKECPDNKVAIAEKEIETPKPLGEVIQSTNVEGTSHTIHEPSPQPKTASDSVQSHSYATELAVDSLNDKSIHSNPGTSSPLPADKISSTNPQCDSESSTKNIYHVKWIEFGLRNTAIITQNENGPCPLISIVNILLLRGKLSLPEGCEIVSGEQLLEYLGDLILNLSGENTDPDLQRNINDAVAVLPRLSTGLDVNVKFTGVGDFEYTPEMLIFDVLHINLYHGWLVDPQIEDLTMAVNSLSYNQLVEKIISNTASSDSELYSQSLVAQQFLEESASQLTYHGLYELNSKLEEQDLAIFFRNNHFSTIYKKNGELFLLVTDQGFLCQKDVVWETLANIEGDSHFVNHLFQNTGVDPRVDQKAAADPKLSLEQDRLLAETLQREVEAEEQRESMFQEFKQNHLGEGLTDEELAMRLQEVENRAVQEEQRLSQAAEQSTSSGRPAPPGNPIGPRQTKKDKNCVIL